EMERFFKEGVCPPKWRTSATVARRKLDMADCATRLLDLASPPGNGLVALKATARATIRSASTTSGGSAFVRHRTGPKTPRSWTTKHKEKISCPTSAPTPARSCARSISRSVQAFCQCQGKFGGATGRARAPVWAVLEGCLG